MSVQREKKFYPKYYIEFFFSYSYMSVHSNACRNQQKKWLLRTIGTNEMCERERERRQWKIEAN